MVDVSVVDKQSLAIPEVEDEGLKKLRFPQHVAIELDFYLVVFEVLSQKLTIGFEKAIDLVYLNRLEHRDKDLLLFVLRNWLQLLFQHSLGVLGPFQRIQAGGYFVFHLILFLLALLS